MECFGGCFSKSEREDEALRKEVNKRINAQILMDKQIFNSIFRLLLVGSEGSGKSTILKQLRMLQGDGFSNEEKRFQLEHIKKNIRDAILSIAGVMSTSTPPVALEHPENMLSVDYIQRVASQPDFEYPSEFYEHTEKLWKDKGVQSFIVEGLNEHQLTDCAKYFLNKVGEIKQPNYRLSEEDILRCRAPTLAVFESGFKVDEYHYSSFYSVFEIGGLNLIEGSVKWRQYFDYDYLRAIIFVADCSSFNTVLGEDNTCQNRLQESLELFMSIWNNIWFRKINLILFLNKQDLLREKVKGGKWKLEDYFPDFEQYQTPADAIPEPGDDHESIRARYFIRDEFLRIREASLEYSRCCYPIFTRALETGNIRRVFDDCTEFVQRMEFGRRNYLDFLLL